MTMDFTTTPRQAELIAQVDRVVEETGGLERVRAFAFKQRLDIELERALAAVIHPGELTLLERVLIAERLAWAGAATTFGLRAVVLGGTVLGDAVLADAVLADAVLANTGPAGARQGLAVVDRYRGGLARYAADAAALLVLNGDEANLVELAPGQVEAVPSGAGFPLGRVPAALLEAGRPVEARGLRARWALAVAAELGGVAQAVVELTAAHLRERVQFGRPLAQFQALRHRVANLAVDAEATRWMAREAAYSGQARPMWLAAAYAAAAGAALSPDAVQLWGARGFVYEFGVSNLIMRLQGLRLELGSADRLAESVLAAPAP
jgi:alkylation response protein AidB-like acyl-CoA dehydrogenase